MWVLTLFELANTEVEFVEVGHLADDLENLGENKA